MKIRCLYGFIGAIMCLVVLPGVGELRAADDVYEYSRRHHDSLYRASSPGESLRNKMRAITEMKTNLSTIETEINTLDGEVRGKLERLYSEECAGTQLQKNDKDYFQQNGGWRFYARDNLSRALTNASKNNNAGVMLAMGMVGQDAAWLIRDLDIDNAWDGVKYGVLFKGARALGDKVEGTIKAEIGGIWDSVIGGTLHSFKSRIQRLWYWMFHKGYRPFDVNTLQSWRDETLNVVFRGLEKRSKESEKNQSQGRDSKLRKLLETTGEDGQPLHIEEGERDIVWERIALMYAQNLDRIANRIEAYKLYYGTQAEYMSDECDILALASGLQDALCLVKDHIILPSRSLKDLAVGDSKLLLPQLAEDIEQRFDLLIEVVRQYHGINKESIQKKNAAKKAPTSNPYGMGLGSQNPYGV